MLERLSPITVSSFVLLPHRFWPAVAPRTAWTCSWTYLDGSRNPLHFCAARASTSKSSGLIGLGRATSPPCLTQCPFHPISSHSFLHHHCGIPRSSLLRSTILHISTATRVAEFRKMRAICRSVPGFLLNGLFFPSEGAFPFLNGLFPSEWALLKRKQEKACKLWLLYPLKEKKKKDL